MTTETRLDLTRLQRPTQSPPTKTAGQVRRSWFTRYVIPGAIVGGFLCLLMVTAGRQFLPRQSITVMPVFVMETQATQTDAPLFQAAGWVEPRPQAVSVAALTAGVVDELLVVEGQLVDRDEPIAKLISQDAELLLRQAQANLSLREGELARAEAELKAAKARLEQPVHLQVILAEANGMLAKSRTELARLPFLIEAARSAEGFAKINLRGKRAAHGGLTVRQVQQAENEYVTANATLKELLDRQPFLQKEVDALIQKVSGVETQLKLLVEEHRQSEEAKAKVQSAEATVVDAKVQVEQAELNLSRTVVKSPMRGRILRLLVSRGTRLMGLETAAGQNTSTVAQMYDPSRLQVRADVRLEDVPKIQIGGKVDIQTASTKDTIQGRILQSTSSANIQKNTLEVKVELIDPPESICPEMLVTTTFLAPKQKPDPTTASNLARISIPQQLIGADESGSFVWIVSPDLRAIRREISLAQGSSGVLREVTSGLTPTDKLIVQGRETLSAGKPLKILGEDQTLGK